MDAIEKSERLRETLKVIANRWTVSVTAVLAEEPLRYGELHRRVDGISQKMLTQTLRALEQNGLVKRKVFPVVPPHVEYELTLLGFSLCDALKPLCLWTEEHSKDMLEARQRLQE